MSERKANRRQLDRREPSVHAKLIDELRMQARTRAALNRMMRVEPSDEKRMLEWLAADALEAMPSARADCWIAKKKQGELVACKEERIAMAYKELFGDTIYKAQLTKIE